MRNFYRGIEYSVRDSFVGYPGYYEAVVGSLEGGDRRMISVESYEELVKEIDAFLD